MREIKKPTLRHTQVKEALKTPLSPITNTLDNAAVITNLFPKTQKQQSQQIPIHDSILGKGRGRGF